MTIIDRARNRAVELLGGVPPAAASERAARAQASGFDEGRAVEASINDAEDEPISGTLKRQGYKSLTRGAIREMGSLSHDQVLNTVWTLYLSNPVAARAMRLKRDYILGRGVKPEAEDDKLQAVLDGFMADNKLDSRLKKFILQLHLLGSQIYPVFVRATDGRVRLGYIDPSQVERVITHPDNVMEKWCIVTKESQSTDKWVSFESKRVYRIVRAQDDVIEGDAVRQGAHAGRRVTAEQAELEPWEKTMLGEYSLTEYTGSCFYFSVNELSNQDQGISDLLQEADWLDQLDATLFALADRENMADFFAWDLTVDGDEPKVKERAAYFRANPPKKGSVYAHNTKESLELKQPDLKQVGHIEAGRTLLRHVLGGLGMPEFWFGFGNETNRATAAESGTPTFRTMEADQDNARDMILEMLYFARDQAIIAGNLEEASADVEIKVSMPEMTTKDFGATAQSLQQVSQALVAVESLGLMTQETMARVWAAFVSAAGVEYDALEELKKIDKEQEKADLADQAKRNALLQGKLAGANGNQPPPGETPPQLAPFAQATGGGG
jgi:hypothetical protein